MAGSVGHYWIQMNKTKCIYFAVLWCILYYEVVYGAMYGRDEGWCCISVYGPRLVVVSDSIITSHHNHGNVAHCMQVGYFDCSTPTFIFIFFSRNFSHSHKIWAELDILHWKLLQIGDGPPMDERLKKISSNSLPGNLLFVTYAHFMADLYCEGKVTNFNWKMSA